MYPPDKPPEKPHEAARKIDPEQRFTPPTEHPEHELTPQELERLEVILVDHSEEDEFEAQAAVADHLLNLPWEIRWYSFQFMSMTDLAGLADAYVELRAEIAAYSEHLALLCVYTLEGARELSDPDNPLAPGEALSQEQAPFETLEYIHSGYAVRKIDSKFADTLVLTGDQMSDAALSSVIRASLKPTAEGTLNTAQVEDEESWNLLMGYVIKLRDQRRLVSNSAAVQVPNDPDTILRYLAGGLIRRTPRPE